jgi:hypothetical protein
MTDAELREISGIAASSSLIRVVLGVGSVFFLVASLALLAVPDSFALWIGLGPEASLSAEVTWILRMLGAALLGLAGQMWLVRRSGDHPVLGAAVIMIVAGGVMTLLTVTMPGTWTPLRWGLLGVGLAFIAAYAILIVTSRRS